jgi:hypothetical protein
MILMVIGEWYIDCIMTFEVACSGAWRRRGWTERM